ncbi:MAG: hypothetical protein IPN36_17830 [Bacteroidetes bacterium]|nr:hypothetical protein [Bacteroidota bacterium]
MNKGEYRNLFFFSLAVICSRIPFVFNGYGSEEDAWALALVAERIGTTGIYEVSRLPGHPLQELIYAAIYAYGAVFFNLLTVMISTLGILSFVAMLQQFEIKNAYWSGGALAFTPIIYINSTNAMDYSWAMAFILMTGYFISNKNAVLAGFLLAMAVGCRITSGAMLIPFTFLIVNILPSDQKTKFLTRFLISLFAGIAIFYAPVFQKYGTGFFSYYEHFPIPGFAKNFYKGSLAVWGLPALLTGCYFIVHLLVKKKKTEEVKFYEKDISKTLLLFCCITVLLYTIAFIQVPLKAAFMIPAVPGIVLLFTLFLQRRQLMVLTTSLFLSCFFFGVNLADAHRGSKASPLAFTFTVSGQNVAFDPLSGLVIADRSKQILRKEYVMSVLDKAERLPSKSVIISGWWYSEILVRGKGRTNENNIFRHYIDEEELKWYQENKYPIFFLEEQDTFNDLRFQKIFTRRYATAL